MAVQSASLGLGARIAVPQRMRAPHAHDDIELNLLLEGSMSYAMGGARLRLEPRRLLAFWAALPHEVVEATDARFLLVTIPLTRFMAWSQASGVLAGLLNGQHLLGSEDLVPLEIARRWPHDLGGLGGVPAAAELEIQAALLRLAQAPSVASFPREAATAVDRMRRAIAERYTEPLGVAEVADAAGLHPNHAMRAFKRATGLSIGACLLDYRLAHAKRLLAMTDLTLPFVTVQAGFGSERRLFEAFRVHVGTTPGEYRRRVRRPDAKD